MKNLTTFACIILSTIACHGQANYILSDHPSQLITGSSKNIVGNAPRFNKVYWESDPGVTINGVKYNKVIEMHPEPTSTAECTFLIPPGYKTMTCMLGMGLQQSNAQAQGHFIGQIYLDDIFKKQAVIKGTSDSPGGRNEFKVDVTGYQTLTLKIDSYGSNAADHACWADVEFHK